MWCVYFFIKLGGLSYLFPNETKKKVLAGSGRNDSSMRVQSMSRPLVLVCNKAESRGGT